LLGFDNLNNVVVVADLEAGIGTLTRLGDRQVDAVLLMVEPTPKSIEVATRAAGLAREKALGRLVVVANRIRHVDDLAAVRAAFPDDRVVGIPDDPAIVEADRRGLAPLDLAPDAPAVRALAELADSLLPTRGPDGPQAGRAGARPPATGS
jgi:CO dehydrogenase maturation factor